MMKTIDFAARARERGVPAHMIDSWVRWIERGRMGGSFMRAVVENDLFGALVQADAVNRENLHCTAMFLRWDAPTGCYGSRAQLERWQEVGGLVGHPLVGRKAT